MGAGTVSRKDTLRALLTARDRQLPAGNSGVEVEPHLPVEAEAPRHLVRSAAVGAMGRSLEKLAHAAEHARAILASGETIVELDPASIDISFINDRFGEPSQEHQSLVASIREHGQQVPILLRPHPDKSGRYQVAYGHRRLKAAAELGRPVRAVVRALSDSELVVAQGQENSARLELSYIERAMFATSIEDRGFDRAVIMAALNVEKTQLSRLISIGRAMPIDVVRLIGPAPKAGRPRWFALAEKLAGKDVASLVEEFSLNQAFLTVDSDSRFAMFLGALEPKPRKQVEIKALTDERGRKIATIRRVAGRATVVVDERVAPEFAEFLIDSLPDLFQNFRVRGGAGNH